MASPKVASIYMPDGVPEGLCIAELKGWTGKILSCPRSSLAALGKRPEALQTGTYILRGIDDSTGFPKVYVGEADNVWSRLCTHDKDPKKEFWTATIVIVSSDNSLTKAHGRYLEASLVREARSANRCQLDNSTDPIGGNLPEAEAAVMNSFLESALVLLPMLGVHVFAPSDTLQPSEVSTTFVLTLPKAGITARAIETSEGVTVLEGSEAALCETAACPRLARDKRKELQLPKRDNEPVLIQKGNKFVFQRRHPFGSPSLAAAVVAGGSISGPANWKTESGLTWDEWHRTRL